jgi:hypothetical protein
LNKKEREYIDNLECVNKIIPTRTPKEYYEDNKDKMKEYREDNKDKIKEVNKIYCENNKDKIKETKKIYDDANKESKKNYRQNNKEKIAEKNKIYRQNNKVKIAEQKHKRYIKKKLFMVLDENKEITQETNNNILLDELQQNN